MLDANASSALHKLVAEVVKRSSSDDSARQTSTERAYRYILAYARTWWNYVGKKKSELICPAGMPCGLLRVMFGHISIAKPSCFKTSTSILRGKAKTVQSALHDILL